METLDVRAATGDELSACADMYAEMYKEAGMMPWEPLDGAWRARFVARYAERIAAGEVLYMIALYNGQIAGSAAAAVRSHPGFAQEMPPIGAISGVYVRPEHRRRDIARRLTLACIEYLRAKGCTRIRLHASAMGRPLYEQLGFLHTNEMELRLEGSQAR